jgi:hypothetical protein
VPWDVCVAASIWPGAMVNAAPARVLNDAGACADRDGEPPDAHAATAVNTAAAATGQPDLHVTRMA